MNILRLLILGAVIYAAYGALCYLLQRSLMYPGRAIDVAGQPPRIPGMVPLYLDTGFGRVDAWFLPAPGIKAGQTGPVVLVFHGNGEVIDFLPEEAEDFRALGMGVLLVEYPGYGRSGGSPSEESITAAAVAAYDAVIGQRGVDAGRVVAFGRSLGGGAACALSRQRHLAAIILQSPFTSTRPFARRMLLPGFLVRDVFDNRHALAAYSGPVLVLHGIHDDIIPVGHGRELARTARRGRLVELACAHNDCPPDRRVFLRTVAGFLRDEGITGPLPP
ncbi:alpha/beta hydrolase [Geobacter hydrogenophilus]|uniref:Alpha/beta hydrolase n=1 Tax=Geobacter hydrogenophilus TaxID=40983 RepID=A0A9W6LBI6_9BACT|nr:alpha/beta hydrolase [Geobacter hydrogenophilus]MBT0894016.1 alpha/beta hydrolase [Geobacter hydrogenophilus]GLI38037.1 alpha/beta hydrolase [Geobacter hydrogenophilus]